jgi:hypothetical protein
MGEIRERYGQKNGNKKRFASFAVNPLSHRKQPPATVRIGATPELISFGKREKRSLCQRSLIFGQEFLSLRQKR